MNEKKYDVFSRDSNGQQFKRVKVDVVVCANASANANVVAPAPAPAPTQWTPFNANDSNTLGEPSLFQFSADGGLVGPLVSACGLNIRAYQQVSASVKSQVVSAVRQEWSDLTDTFIRAKWPGGSDIFYVLCEKETDRFIGCMAVDRRNFYPYISNLYVGISERKKGHGKQLLEHGMAFTKSMGFPDARLWCKPELLEWYKGKGMDWTIDGQQSQDGITIHLMVKKIVIV
jgi:hypothetical protein